MRSVALGRDASTDFAVRGSDRAVQAASQTKAFWNAKLQGTDKLLRVLATKNGWTMGVAMMTVPTVALWDINKDDPYYHDLPLYQRMTGWNIPIGKHPDGRTRFQWVPKPFEAGFLFASLPELLLNFAYLRDGELAMAGLLELLDQTKAGAMPIPDMIAPLAEASTGPGGFDNFRQREIVDRRLQQEPVRDQSDLRTGALASGAAAVINAIPGEGLDVAPAKVQHIIGDWQGTLGRMANQNVIDPLARLAGLDDRPVKPARSLEQRTRFLADDPLMQAESVRQIYRKHDRGTEKHGVATRMRQAEQEAAWTAGSRDDDPPSPKADAYAERYRKEIEWFFDMGPHVQELNRIYAKMREIGLDRTLSSKEKQRQLGVMGREGQRVARMPPQPRDWNPEVIP